MRRIVHTFYAFTLLSLCFVAHSASQNFSVNSSTDNVDINPGDGIGADILGRCTLRAAVMEANALGGNHTIMLPPGTYTLTISGSSENAATSGDLDITCNLSIIGGGAASTIIDGGGIDRVFEVHSGTAVQMNMVTVRNGTGDGGGVLNWGTMTFTSAMITGNTNSGWGGTGIYNIGTITLTNCTVSNNIGTGTYFSGGGGGIFSQGTMTLIGTTVSGNVTVGRGGGIYNLDLATTLINSTISGNTARNGGGIFNRYGTIHLTNSTIAVNTATDNGGGVWSYGGSSNLKNTIIADNRRYLNTSTGTSNDCSGNLISLGYNLISDNSGGLSGTGDLNDSDPLLGLLEDNGGPTLTHALQVGSPAIDVVPLAFNTVTTDQRGIARPQGPTIDIGAYERKPPASFTKLRDQDCGATMISLGQFIYCDPIQSATNYQWEFTHVQSGFLKTVQKGNSLTNLYLTGVQGMQYGKTYNVRIKPFKNGVWEEYGPICQITVPSPIPQTKVRADVCGSSTSSLAHALFCDPVAGAQNYQWEFANTDIGYHQFVNRGSNSLSFTLGWVPGIRYGYTYEMRVRANVGGEWGDYGTVCQLSLNYPIPTTKVRFSECGKTLSSMTQFIYCDAVAGSTDYQWEISNAGANYLVLFNRNSSSTNFRIEWIPGIQYGLTYAVRVRAKVAGEWAAFGNTCFITTPAVPVISDTDGDGIADDVDTQPNVFSDSFSDAGLGGTTTGTITDRGARTWCVFNEPNPKGIHLIVGTGAAPAEIVGTGICLPMVTNTIPANNTADFLLECGSVSIEMIKGQLVSTAMNGGVSVVLFLTVGSSISLSSQGVETMVISSDSSISDVNLVTNGEAIVLGPNRKLTVKPQYVMNCPTSLDANNIPGECNSIVDYAVTATSSPAPTVVCTPASGSAFAVGTTLVSCTASNSAGSVIASFLVTVGDPESPWMTCPSDIIVNPTSLSGVVVDYEHPIGQDNCGDITAIQISGLPSGSTFPIGTTTNTFTAFDAYTNSVTCSFTVTVNDPTCADNKVYVCHEGNTICISVNAVQAHLDHGDIIGECSFNRRAVVERSLPDEFELSQNYPNPFNPSTRLRYVLPIDAFVELDVMDNLGRTVAELVNDFKKAGSYDVEFNASYLSSGMYYYRLRAGEQIIIRKMAVMR